LRGSVVRNRPARVSLGQGRELGRPDQWHRVPDQAHRMDRCQRCLGLPAHAIPRQRTNRAFGRTRTGIQRQSRGHHYAMSATLPPDLLLPNAHERRQIFYLLKKESSWTAWNRIQGYYKAWVDAVEESVRQSDENGWMERTSVAYSAYVRILKGYAHFEEGVERLRKGDKRVFQYNAHGEFAMAARTLDHWQQLLWLVESGDNGIDYDHTPNWDAVAKAITDLNNAWLECGPNIL